MNFIEYISSINLRFTDFDSYGIAHHSKYLVWFEECRIRFIDKVDKEGIWKNYRFLLTHAEVNYKKAVLFDENYDVHMMLKIDEDIAKIHFSYKIINQENGRVCATGSTSHIITDDKNRILIKVPLDFKIMLENAKISS